MKAQSRVNKREIDYYLLLSKKWNQTTGYATGTFSKHMPLNLPLTISA